MFNIDVEIYVKEHFDKHARLRETGVVTRGMAYQFMKAVQHCRLMKFSPNLHKLQTPD